MKVTQYISRIAMFLAILIFIQPMIHAETLNLVYDQNGNLVSGDGMYREYNSQNQLVKIYNGSDSGGELLQEFIHDPIEERIAVKKVYEEGILKETVLYFGQDFVRVVNASGSFDTEYVHLNGQMVAQVNPDGSRYFKHTDHLGSVSVLTNESGDVIENTTISPFGEVVSGGSESRYGYEGKEHDSLVGDTDFNFRKYKPDWGMFTQPDSLLYNIFDPQNLNRYSFENNNPYNNIDPSGHSDYGTGNTLIVIITTVFAPEVVIAGVVLTALGFTIIHIFDNANEAKNEVKADYPGLDGNKYENKEDWLDNELPREGEFSFEDPSPKKRGGKDKKYKYDEEGNPVDKKGRSWKPDRPEKHWDVQDKNGPGYTRVTKDGTILSALIIGINTKKTSGSSGGSSSSPSSSIDWGYTSIDGTTVSYDYGYSSYDSGGGGNCGCTYCSCA